MFYFITGYPTGHAGNNEVPGPIEITSGSEQQWGEQPRLQPAVIQPSPEAQQTQRNSFFKTTEEQLKV